MEPLLIIVFGVVGSMSLSLGARALSKVFRVDEHVSSAAHRAALDLSLRSATRSPSDRHPTEAVP